MAAVDLRRDPRELVELFTRAHANSGLAEVSLRPAGFSTEIASRPGRIVWAWIARADAADSLPLGGVVLVRAGSLETPRWSIAWLVVDRAARRRGVGSALVATAVKFAGDRGASLVHAETLARWPAAVGFWRAARLAAEEHPARIQGSGESRKTAEG